MAIDPRHPIYSVPRPTYWVPPMDGLAKAVNLGIEYNRHGLLGDGLGRIGKTEALMMLQRTTDWRQFAMTFDVVLPGAPNSSSEHHFFSQAALDGGLKVRASSPSGYIVDMYANHLCERASLTSSEIIVIALDDANRLKRQDYDHLVTLDNKVSVRGYRLFVIIMLQEDADQSEVPISEMVVHPSQITGRFTADRYYYTGLQGVPDISTAFANFLAQTWGGRTFLEECAPTLYARGWQCTDLSLDFWRQAGELRGQNGLLPDAPFPMQCFDPASYHLFGRIAPEDRALEGFTDEQITQALKYSGLIELELSRVPRAPR